jgi:hypothetical protein
LNKASICPQCGLDILKSMDVCPDCGYEFNAGKSKSQIGRIQVLNPFVSMLLKPRKTIQQLLHSYDAGIVFILILIASIAKSFDLSSFLSLGNDHKILYIILFAISFGFVRALFVYTIFARLLTNIGNSLGGKATIERVRSALAWSSIPIIWAILLWIPDIVILKGNIFKYEFLNDVYSTLEVFTYYGISVLELIITIWSFMIFLVCLSEAQKLSMKKAFWSVFLLTLLIVVPIGAIAGIALFVMNSNSISAMVHKFINDCFKFFAS